MTNSWWNDSCVGDCSLKWQTNIELVSRSIKYLPWTKSSNGFKVAICCTQVDTGWRKTFFQRSVAFLLGTLTKGYAAPYITWFPPRKRKFGPVTSYRIPVMTKSMAAPIWLSRTTYSKAFRAPFKIEMQWEILLLMVATITIEVSYAFCQLKFGLLFQTESLQQGWDI